MFGGGGGSHFGVKKPLYISLSSASAQGAAKSVVPVDPVEQGVPVDPVDLNWFNWVQRFNVAAWSSRPLRPLPCYYYASTGSTGSADLACPPGQFDHHDYYCYYYVSTGSSESIGSTGVNWVNWINRVNWVIWINWGQAGQLGSTGSTATTRLLSELDQERSPINLNMRFLVWSVASMR